MNLSKITDTEKHIVIDHDGYLTDFKTPINATDKKKPLIKMIACGDTSPVRKLEKKVLEGKSTHILGNLKPILQNADLVFANLEAVYSNRGVPLDRVPVFRLNPKAFDIIKEANINVVSLANNHMFDYGPNAFIDTIELLEKNKISYFGAGFMHNEALKPLIMEVKGIRLGFIGFRDKEVKGFDDNGVITPQIDADLVYDSIKGLKQKVDLLILSLHFGFEYKFYPSPKDVALCRNFIDAGVDIILGHHPHYPQGIEKYKNGLIAYSLGNFIWDQHLIGHTNSSYILELEITKKSIYSAKVIPFEMKQEYQLEIKNDNYSIDELNSFSCALIDKNTLKENWYFICRNKFLEQLIELKNTVFENKFDIKIAVNFIRGKIASPRNRYAWISLLYYILSFNAFKYEIKRSLRKTKRRE